MFHIIRSYMKLEFLLSKTKRALHLFWSKWDPCVLFSIWPFHHTVCCCIFGLKSTYYVQKRVDAETILTLLNAQIETSWEIFQALTSRVLLIMKFVIGLHKCLLWHCVLSYLGPGHLLPKKGLKLSVLS